MIKKKTVKDPSFKTIPKHVAVIMDGNGRWAKQKGLLRTEGHKKGRKAINNLIEVALNYHIKHLSLFAFSSENWSRPKSECDFLMDFVLKSIDDNLDFLTEHNIKLNFIKLKDKRLSSSILNKIHQVEKQTKQNSALNLHIMFNYGSKQFLIDCMNKHIDEFKKPITLKTFEKVLKGNTPDPDILIRTGYTKRLSNYMLWELAYTELFFLDIFWPEFKQTHFLKILEDYQHRARRFGGLS